MVSLRLRLRVEENMFEFLFGNESFGELQLKRWRLRGKRKSKDDLWFFLKCLVNFVKEIGVNKGEFLKNKMKDVEKCDIENMGFLIRVKDKS